MRLLLINNNPAVSRLINLSAEKYGYQIEEFKSDDFDLNENYDITITDNEAVSDNTILLLRESGSLGDIIYIGPKGLPKPIYADYFLQKPFLPTDFIDMIKKIEKSKQKEEVITPPIEEQEEENEINIENDIQEQDEYSEPIALDLDDLDSLDLPMPDDDYLGYGEVAEELKEEDNDIKRTKEQKVQEDEIQKDAEDKEELNPNKDISKAKDTQVEEGIEEDVEEESIKEEKIDDVPEDFKLEEEKNTAEETNESILDSDDIDEVKQLLNEDESSPEPEVIDEDFKYIRDTEDKIVNEVNIEEAMMDVSPQDKILGELVQESEDLDNPVELLKEIENLNEDDNLQDNEKKENIQEIEPILSEEKSSIDDLAQEDLDGFFEDMEEEKAEEIKEEKVADIEGIQKELHDKIKKDVKKVLDKDEIKEALKGLKVNISISFDEVQG